VPNNFFNVLRVVFVVCIFLSPCGLATFDYLLWNYVGHLSEMFCQDVCALAEQTARRAKMFSKTFRLIAAGFQFILIILKTVNFNLSFTRAFIPARTRHSREGGNPARPEYSGKEVKAQFMDSRLRGNDERG